MPNFDSIKPSINVAPLCTLPTTHSILRTSMQWQSGKEAAQFNSSLSLQGPIILMQSLALVVVDGEAKRDFSAVTNMEDEFYSKGAKLIKVHSKEDQLVYKVSGDTGKPLYMDNEHDFKAAMERVANKAKNACTQAVSLEIKNTQNRPPNSTAANKDKKRSRTDNVPPKPNPEFTSQLKAFKILEMSIQCKMQHGHCFINRKHGMDNHCRLSHKEMTLWAKQIELPAKHFDSLLENLWLAEIVTIDQILMALLGSLSKVGGMGTNHATILKSYAKRTVMSVFGLHGSKDELAIYLSEVKSLPVILEKKRRHNKSLEVIEIGSDGSELEFDKVDNADDADDADGKEDKDRDKEDKVSD
ncbi:hypothetical protein SERLA73DRAFT_149175 [Serpula lacrymans var. lacrymans S7.3]|uniref:Uncharacterized protein n=1 Tax=Serpula lacrymans var. lacrymans (strain S7.3) TaxID=936435 RepID=F8PGA6_SERL3|nr:hypothetical protein SERLA73DRAFT_149175 [Serpula lacrymans var. lacrymans S7.3]